MFQKIRIIFGCDNRSQFYHVIILYVHPHEVGMAADLRRIMETSIIWHHAKVKAFVHDKNYLCIRLQMRLKHVTETEKALIVVTTNSYLLN